MLTPSPTAACPLVDVDLSILGQAETRFDEYQAQIRSENAWIPEAEYRQARLRILEGSLERDRIYCTQPFFDRPEAQARGNLERALRQLRSAP